MKRKFVFSLTLGGCWLAVSLFFAIGWAQGLAYLLPPVYVWWVIIGIALLPGFLMSTMFFSNLMNQRLKTYPDITQNTTIIMCAHNEQYHIARAIHAILQQRYAGHIRLIVVDNASTDNTKQQIRIAAAHACANCSVEYLYCDKPGKANALNAGLQLVCTPYFLTVDADTYLEKNAVQRIMNHIVCRKCACVAGNLFVNNTHESIFSKMQNYDYLLSIAAVKRFQGSFHSTLVAQGAFSAYDTCEVRKIGGWQNVLGEDIVLTYRLLEQGLVSGYESQAVGYTVVPTTFNGLYNQRKRWGIGMLEGLRTVPPCKQGTAYSRYFTSVNLSVIYLDLAFLFGFIPGVVLACFGYYYFVGILTLYALAMCVILFWSMYRYQKKLGIPFHNSFIGFVCFLLFFQLIQSTAALHGYLIYLFHHKGEWK